MLIEYGICVKYRFSYLIVYINIDFISIDIERNSKRGGEQRPLIKEVFELIHNDDTAVAKALSFLELVAREKIRKNDMKASDEIAPRAIEFDNDGMNKCQLNFNTNVDKRYIKIISKIHNFHYSHSTYWTSLYTRTWIH